MAARNWIRLSALVVLTAQLALTGCTSPRQAALMARAPGNRVFQPDADTLAMAGGAPLVEFDRADGQNVCLLQLAGDATLERRYHALHDMVLCVVKGSGIVIVEGERYVVGPGSAVVVPRLYAYSVEPHEGDEGLTALLIYAPPFDGTDVMLGE